MSDRERFLTALEDGQRLCDDCLSEVAGFPVRQVAHQLGTALKATGRISRTFGAVCSACRKSKICSWTTQGPPESDSTAVIPAVAQADRSWYWEGNIQSALAEWLAKNGWRVRSTADTAALTQGVDIIAEDQANGRELWVSVKGYPDKSPSVQAGHWFAGAVFDLVRYRELGHHRDLAIALPDGFARYLNLAPKVKWLRDTMPFQIYWVGETGSIRWE